MWQVLASRTGTVGSDRCSPRLAFLFLNAFPELDFIMDVVVRTYSGKGSKELFSLLEKNKADIEKQMRTIYGFESYTLARNNDSDGGLSRMQR